MKKIYFLLMAIIFLSFGCGAYVNYGSRANGEGGREIKFDYAGGYSSPERGLEVLEQQERTKTQILLQQKLRDAIKDGNDAEVERLNRVMAGSTFATSNENVRMLGLINKSSQYVIKMLSAPFDGVMLSPGERLISKRAVPIGLYQAKYQECRIGESSCTIKTTNVSIGRYRTDPLVILSM